MKISKNFSKELASMIHSTIEHQLDKIVDKNNFPFDLLARDQRVYAVITVSDDGVLRVEYMRREDVED